MKPLDFAAVLPGRFIALRTKSGTAFVAIDDISAVHGPSLVEDVGRFPAVITFRSNENESMAVEHTPEEIFDAIRKAYP